MPLSTSYTITSKILCKNDPIKNDSIKNDQNSFKILTEWDKLIKLHKSKLLCQITWGTG